MKPTRLMLVTLPMAGVWTLVPCAGGAEPLKPVVHLVGPSEGYADQFDPMVAATAMRLAAGELAVRYGAYARYWPADQQKDLPADAFPRVELRARGMGRMPYLRLQRRGDVFTCLGSDDGATYLVVARYRMRLKKPTYVGIMFAARWNNRKPVTAVLENVRLNGQPFAGEKRADIGQCFRRADVRREDRQWHITTYGRRAAEGSRRERGPFLYRTVDGDFVIDAKVAGTTEQTGTTVGVHCRDGLDENASSFGFMLCAGWAWGMARPVPFASMQPLRNHTSHRLTARCRLDRRRRVSLAEVPVSLLTWKTTTEAIAGLAEGIVGGLARELKLEAKALRPARATDAQLAVPNKAREAAMGCGSGEILRAADDVGRVLGEAPACPEARYTAGVCGAVLACQDLLGTFHQRGRYLAGPLSEWMLARRLAPAKRREDILAGAWVTLACGYPNAARAEAGRLARSERSLPEVRALEMFLTRDYRALKPTDVEQAAAIEQLAWLWATQECGREDLLEEIPARLAGQRQSCAFLPLRQSVGVGSGHSFSVAGPALAMACDGRALLLCEAIEKGRRLAAGRKLAAALDLPARDDLPELAGAIHARLLRTGPPGALAPALAALVELYDAASAGPAGPVSADGKLQWHALSVRDFAGLQRALLILTLYRRADFVGHWWGVSDAADAFCQEVARGLSGVPGAPGFFQALALCYLKKKDEAEKAWQSAMRGRFARLPAVVLLAGAQAPRYTRKFGFWDRHDFPGGRGSWEWKSIALGACYVNVKQSFNYAAFALGVDDYAGRVHNPLMWLAGDVSVADEMLGRMPYHLALLTDVALFSGEFKQYERAQRAYERLIRMAPNEPCSYFCLARMHAERKQLDKAVAVAERAAKNLPFTVGLSNLMGLAAGWLVELGRNEEALEMGRRAAGSYSATGLKGLALALQANGRTEEALKAHRARAHRYEGCTYDFVVFLLRAGLGGEQVVREIRNLLQQHTQAGHVVRQRVRDAFVEEPGHFKIMEAVFAGPLSDQPPAEQKLALLLSALHVRDFPRVLRYAGQLRSVKPLTPYQLLWAHVAARMTGDASARKQLEAEMAKLKDTDKVGSHIAYVLGRHSAQRMLEDSHERAQIAYAHWLLGVTAELKKDMAAARKEYGAAAQIEAASQGRWVPEKWLELLGEEDRPSTAPAR